MAFADEKFILNFASKNLPHYLTAPISLSCSLLKPIGYIPLFWIVILISRHLRVVFAGFAFSEWTITAEMPREPQNFDRSEVFIAKLSICMSANKKTLKTKISSEY